MLPFKFPPIIIDIFAVRMRGNLKGNISISNLYWMFLLSFWFPPKDIGAAVLSRQNNLISRATRPAFSSKDKWISQPHSLYFPLADIRIFSGRQIQIYLSVEIEIGWTRARTEKFYQSSHSSLLSWMTFEIGKWNYLNNGFHSLKPWQYTFQMQRSNSEEMQIISA